ncbi:hypothetical protein [Qipengyuania zhejiangensis]|uniref:hypothetical protein n=1 Tax=Qipengyuania zhejiangensis TaxID=3077782 RepID=UPI002D787FD3|nr:hypothetical protein [Qipengyuania sp. Z2]
MHPLQQIFATAEGETGWEADMHLLFEQGEFDTLHCELENALAALDSDFGSLCLQTRPDMVRLAGWEELVEAITVHEGEPITGLTLAVANESDRVFEKGQLHHPYMMLGLYSDDAFEFSKADAAALLAQTRAEDGPAWDGYDEDVEVHLDIEGLDAINTALLHHKQRHYFRDGPSGEAPLRYVEYVLGCWWRALLFQQAIASECAIHGLPGGIPVICGMVEMRPELVVIHGIGARAIEPARVSELKPVSPLIAADFIQVRPMEEEAKELTGADLRRRVIETGQEDEPPVRRSFIARLFGR